MTRTYYDWIVFWICWNTILMSTMTVCQLGPQPQWWYFLSRRSCHDRWCVVCGVWWVVSETINIVVLWVLGHRATPCVGPRSVLYSVVPSSAGERERGQSEPSHSWLVSLVRTGWGQTDTETQNGRLNSTRSDIFQLNYGILITYINLNHLVNDLRNLSSIVLWDQSELIEGKGRSRDPQRVVRFYLVAWPTQLSVMDICFVIIREESCTKLH